MQKPIGGRLYYRLTIENNINRFALTASQSEIMSGSETLVPFINEKKPKGEEPTIIMDSREASSAKK